MGGHGSQMEDARLAAQAAGLGDPIGEAPLRRWRIHWADLNREATEVAAQGIALGMDPFTPTTFQSPGGKQTVLAPTTWLLIEELEPPNAQVAGPPDDQGIGDDVFKVVEVLTAARFTQGQGTNDATLAKAIVARLREPS